MRLGLVGLPQVGKKTLFRLLTGHTGEIGQAKVRDVRFDRLVQMYKPEREVPAEMAFVLLPDLDTQADRNIPVFRDLEQVDVICLLARVFENDTVFHIAGDLDAKRDVQTFWEELLLADLIFVEKRLERLAKDRHTKDKLRAEQEKDLMTRMQAHLETGKTPASVCAHSRGNKTDIELSLFNHQSSDRSNEHGRRSDRRR